MKTTIMGLLALLLGTGTVAAQSGPVETASASAEREVGSGGRRSPETGDRDPVEKPTGTKRPTTERSSDAHDDCDCCAGREDAREARGKPAKADKSKKVGKRDHPNGKAGRGRSFGQDVRELVGPERADELTRAVREAAVRAGVL